MRYLVATIGYLLFIAIPVGIGALLSVWIAHRDDKNMDSAEID